MRVLAILLLVALGAGCSRAPGPSGAPDPPAPVEEAPTVAAQPEPQTLQVDLVGDGRRYLVRAQFGEWSTAPLEFYQADGSLIERHEAEPGGQHRVEQVTFTDMRRPAFLVQRRSATGEGGVTILTARVNPYMQSWSMEPVAGWGVKLQGTAADRVWWTEAGRITVEWEMGDPAGHTRVTEYRWVEEEESGWPNVQTESVAYRPTGDSLLYPSTPQAVLQAAFVAWWFGLGDELPRYFLSPEAAATLAATSYSEPNYGPGLAQIGMVTPPDRQDSCGATVTAAEPQGDGPHPFAAGWGGYEWCEGTWGQVTFGQDGQGRPVILQLDLEGRAFHGH